MFRNGNSEQAVFAGQKSPCLSVFFPHLGPNEHDPVSHLPLKEKFCLLVLSMPANQLLRPAIQEALLFLTEKVLLLLPRQLKQWYQYLKLPFPTQESSS
jgi:hypothetical protein